METPDVQLEPVCQELELEFPCVARWVLNLVWVRVCGILDCVRARAELYSAARFSCCG